MRLFYLLITMLFVGVAFLFPGCDGKPGASGPTGPSGVPTPYCSSPSNKGVTTAGTSSSQYFEAGGIYANPITFTTATTAISLSVDVTSEPVTGQVIMGLYSNNGSNLPGNLVVESAPQKVVVGWNTCPVSPTYIPVGTYWMTFIFSNETYGSYNTPAGTLYDYTYGWGVLPTTAPAGPTVAYQVSMYVSTCP